MASDAEKILINVEKEKVIMMKVDMRLRNLIKHLELIIIMSRIQ